MANAEAFWDSGNVLFLNLGASDTDVLFALILFILCTFPYVYWIHKIEFLILCLSRNEICRLGKFGEYLRMLFISDTMFAYIALY